MTQLNINLSSEQQFFIERLKRTIHQFPPDELARLVIDLQSQCFSYQNAFKSVIKNEINNE
jgi:hypothetical protein